MSPFRLLLLMLLSLHIVGCSVYPTDINARLVQAENNAAEAKAIALEAKRLAELAHSQP
ncbi:hypothetical protein P6F15_04010 [Thiopseudomonas alkaliphila]|uniref:hypothetical protein n=1 Tax=Thiopseudomonas alkaliphila TaxID=1697053 RepID=UPI003570C794